MNNKVYRKTLAKVDKFFTWNTKDTYNKMTMYCSNDYFVTVSIFKTVMCKYIAFHITNKTNNKTIHLWCKNFAELRQALQVVELLG